MGTATVDVSAKTTTERFDRAYGFKLGKNDKGEVTKEAVVLTTEEAEKLDAAGSFEGSIITVSVDYPANWDGLMAYADKSYTDDEGQPRETNEVLNELVKLFRSGASAKVNNRLRAILTKTAEDGSLSFNEKEQAPNGVLDLTGEITSGSKRVFLTEEQKTWRSLSNLPDAIRKQMYDVYLTSIGKTAGAYPAE